jgi:hypothetical protein
MAESSDSVITLPKLGMQGGPGDELRAVLGHAVQPLGKPHVHVQGHNRMSKGGNGAFIQGYGVH